MTALTAIFSTVATPSMGGENGHGDVAGFVKTFQHGFHAFGSRGNERQAVAPAPLQEEIIEGLETVVPQGFALFSRISGSSFSRLCRQDNIDVLSVFHLTRWVADGQGSRSLCRQEKDAQQ